MSNEAKNENKATKFLKKHWKKGLVILGAAVIGGVCGYAVFKSFSNLTFDQAQLVPNGNKLDWAEISDELFDGATLNKAEEHIFTAVAPALYKAVLDKDVEKGVIETAYDLGDNLSKMVTITVENVYGD